MKIRTIDWNDNSIKIIDQTKLPGKLVYLYIRDLKALWSAIKALKVRGAPALGAAAGLGVYLGMKKSRAKDFTQLEKELDTIISYIGSSRPTAVNLFWGLERMRKAALRNRSKPVERIKQALLAEAQKIIAEDRAACRRIAHYGAKLLRKGDNIMTVCNAGILATIDYGTALGVIYRAKEQGKNIKVFACETRPLLQGSRLTCWELQKKGVSVTLICDSMAAMLMSEGKIDKVIAGADRIAANGDCANKIGTYNLAVLSKYHGIPFFVAAPLSTFDPGIRSAKDIPIEERAGQEVTGAFFRELIRRKRIKVSNPAFDVTPHRLISAIITDKGAIRFPCAKNIRRLLKNAE